MTYNSTTKKNEILHLQHINGLKQYAQWNVRERQIQHDITHIWSKNNTSESVYKAEIDSQTQKTNLWLPRRRGGINQNYGIKRYKKYYTRINKQ